MVKLRTNFGDYRNESTFYFRNMEQCDQFISVFKDHWCNIPWLKPIDLGDNVIIPNYALRMIDIDPKDRAIANLSWGFNMAKVYNIGLSEEQQKALEEMMEQFKSEEVKEPIQNEREPISITKEQFKAIFNFGVTYGYASSNPGKFVSNYPAEDYERALDYTYRFVIEGERDEECLRCAQYICKECDGTINRGRETITDSNRCAFYKKLKGGI